MESDGQSVRCPEKRPPEHTLADGSSGRKGNGARKRADRNREQKDDEEKYEQLLSLLLLLLV